MCAFSWNLLFLLTINTRHFCVLPCITATSLKSHTATKEFQFAAMAAQTACTDSSLATLFARLDSLWRRHWFMHIIAALIFSDSRRMRLMLHHYVSQWFVVLFFSRLFGSVWKILFFFLKKNYAKISMEMNWCDIVGNCPRNLFQMFKTDVISTKIF